MSLEWEESYDARTYFAMCGRVTIGRVHEEGDGSWSWSLFDALAKSFTRTNGKRPSRPQAMASLDNAWGKWLAAAHLRFIEPSAQWREKSRRGVPAPANDA